MRSSGRRHRGLWIALAVGGGLLLTGSVNSGKPSGADGDQHNGPDLSELAAQLPDRLPHPLRHAITSDGRRVTFENPLHTKQEVLDALARLADGAEPGEDQP